MIEDTLLKVLDYGMSIFILIYLGNKITVLTKAINDMNNHLTTIADNINILRVSKSA